MEIPFLWAMAPYRLEYRYKRFEGSWCLRLQGTSLNSLMTDAASSSERLVLPIQQYRCDVYRFTRYKSRRSCWQRYGADSPWLLPFIM